MIWILSPFAPPHWSEGFFGWVCWSTGEGLSSRIGSFDSSSPNCKRINWTNLPSAVNDVAIYSPITLWCTLNTKEGTNTGELPPSPGMFTVSSISVSGLWCSRRRPNNRIVSVLYSTFLNTVYKKLDRNGSDPHYSFFWTLQHNFWNYGFFFLNYSHLTPKHTQLAERHAPLAKANTSFKTILTSQNSIKASKLNTQRTYIPQLPTDVPNVKHYYLVS